ncbi:MAG: DUF6054 family protein [Eubacteriales bacterium]
MAEQSFRGRGDAKVIARMITDEVQAAGVTNNLVGSKIRENGDMTVVLLVFEKYYMRASNRASLSVMISQARDGEMTVDAVSSGGGQGVIFSFSWGAEDNFIGLLQKILTQRGFY